MNDGKITQLKNMIYKYIYDENIDIYIKLQTFFEFLIKDYIRTKGIFKYEFEESKTIDLIHQYSGKYDRIEEIISVVKEVNRKSNAGLKHYNDMIVFYDKIFVKRVVFEINRFNYYLFGKNNRKYYIDENIFEQLNIDVQNQFSPVTSEHLEVVPELKKQFFDQNQEGNQNIIKSNFDILINIGTSNNDFGFVIKKLQQEFISKFKYESIYATIFNFFQRNSKLEKDTIILKYEDQEKLIFDYKKVYRFEMVLLLLIKNNYFKENKIRINSYEKYNNELKCAIYHISEHFSRISHLMKKKLEQIEFEVVEESNAISISLHNNSHAEIVLEDLTERVSRKRYLWFAPNLKYEINHQEEADNKFLCYYLKDFFQYERFKPGQLESLEQILNSNNNQIIIMPTGSGKSLIYYFVGLLQPSPSVIVSPTDILIKDQIRNLIALHNIDDCDGYYSSENVNIVTLQNKFNFITPATLQKKNIIKNLISYNVDNKIANIFLDEIHTISNWSHSFNPNYLMLSFNLLTFLDTSKYVGFTATANYRVIKDISQQLKIDFENIITPIELKNNNGNFMFLSCDNENKFNDQFNKFVNDVLVDSNGKAIVFTKSKEDNEKILKSINNELKIDIDIFTEQNENSYLGFVKGRRSILVSESDMGVGINIPSVSKIMHYGLPISKAKYVQEIGRAGRNGSDCQSVVVYKNKKNMSNKELKLLDFNSSIDEILDIISENDSDLSNCFKSIIGHLDHYSIVSSKIYSLYQKLLINNDKQKSHEIIKLNNQTKIEKVKNEVYLYFLVKMGIVYNWYILEIGDDYTYYDVEICENISLSYIKQSCIEYISIFGESKETIYRIESSDTVKNIIYELQDWYFNQFLLYHREQLLNMLDFFEINERNQSTSRNIIDQLSNYFSISSTDIEMSASEYLKEIKMNQKIEYLSEDKNIFSLLEDVVTSDSGDIIKIQMEGYLETRYDSMADLYIFLYNLFKMNSLSKSRFERIFREFTESQLKDYVQIIPIIYNKINDIEENMEFIRIYMERMNEEEIYDTIFSECEKDLIYYHYITKQINSLLRRKNYGKCKEN